MLTVRAPELARTGVEHEGQGMADSEARTPEHERDVALMRRALELAARGPLADPNPRVGAVILDRDGTVVGEGFHEGAGTPHAEVIALRQAGAAARGGTAVVTLEPCAHTGLTGPCSLALVEAGVARVVFAQSDPNPSARGGRAVLEAAGIRTTAGVLVEESTALNDAWTFSFVHGRPKVTWKFAATLDGRSAAADGSSRWITGPLARADVHQLRAQCDAILVGTGTVIADDPALTVRGPDGTTAGRQPLRVVMGLRPIPEFARVLDLRGADAPAGHPRPGCRHSRRWPSKKFTTSGSRAGPRWPQRSLERASWTRSSPTSPPPFSAQARRRWGTSAYRPSTRRCD